MSQCIAFDRFTLDAERRQLRDAASGSPVALSARAFDTLLHLVRHRGELVTKAELLDTVWQGLVVEENNLSQAISQVRRALEDNGQDRRFIVTAPGQGYRFVAETRDARTETANRAPEPVARPADTGQPRPFHRSLAVLPFANLTGDPANDYIGDGVAEEILDLLGACSGLRLAARSSSFALRLRELTGIEAARELGVETILEGSVRGGAHAMRISARIVSGADGLVLWTRTFDCELADIFAVQMEVATATAEALSVKLEHATGDLNARRLTPDETEAMRHILRAQWLVGESTPQAFRAARDLCEQALRIAPDFSEALGTMAAVLVIPELYAPRPDRSRVDLAEHFAKRALDLPGSTSKPLLPLGQCHAIAGKLVDADRDFQSVIAARPADPMPPMSYSTMVVANVGHLKRAADLVDRALALIPFHPVTATLVSMLHAFIDDMEAARHYLRIAESMGMPRESVIYGDTLALLQLRNGEFEVAGQSVLRTIAGVGDRPLEDAIRIAYAALADPNRLPKARATLRALVRSSTDDRLEPATSKRLVLLLSLVGDYDEALDLLRRVILHMVELGVPSAGWSFVWLSEMRPVRLLPGFVEIARLLGMVEYWENFGPPDGHAWDGTRLVEVDSRPLPALH